MWPTGLMRPQETHETNGDSRKLQIINIIITTKILFYFVPATPRISPHTESSNSSKYDIRRYNWLISPSNLSESHETPIVSEFPLVSMSLMSLKSLWISSVSIGLIMSLVVAESHLSLIVSLVSLDLMSLYWFIKSPVVTDSIFFWVSCLSSVSNGLLESNESLMV